MGKNFVMMCTAIALILGFFTMPAFADEAAKKEEPMPKAEKTLKVFDGIESLNLWGGTNLRLYSKLYEGGHKAYDSYLALQARLGFSVDMDTVFWSFELTTAKPYDETYGVGTSTYVPFYFMNHFNAYIRHAYAVWRYDEKMYMALGRFDKTIDKKKKYVVGRSELTFHGDYSYDGLGLFTNLMENDGTTLNLAVLVNYLGKFKGTTVDTEDSYSHFWLIGVQPQLNMKMSDMSLTAWAGFWTITHPDHLASNSPSSTVYGTNAIGGDKDANLMLVEAYAKLGIGSFSAWMHLGFNMGAEEQNVGMVLGLYYGSVKKPGNFGIGVNLFYIDQYMWYDKFVDSTMGVGQRGAQVLIDYCFWDDMFFYSVLTFKNKIGGGAGDGQAYFKIGVKVKWKTSGGKLK